MRIIAIVAVLVTCCLGCQDTSVPNLREEAQDVLEGARARAGELRELSADELRELWAIEYTSVRATRLDPAAEQALLNEMGEERWDCFHVSETGTDRVFYFKRRKSNATAYLTNLLRMGALAF